jgi:type I restriction enzyme M protein
MLDTDTKRRIDTCRDILVGKVPDPKSQVEQITIALIYKFMDDMDLEAEELGGQRRFFIREFERYRWAKLVAPGVTGQEMLNTYSEALQKMVENEGLPPFFRQIFRNAYLPYRDPETLRAFLREIDTFTYDHSERLGDAFEYLLSVLGSQGDAGQFRTPRHIIDFMVEIISPQKHEVILDPACGTAGFLISAYKHILKQNTTGVVSSNGGEVGGDAAEQALESPKRYKGDLLTLEDRARLARNIKGYDLSPDMVRLSRVNMFLHDFKEPLVEEYDTLSSDDKWQEMADVILANPPFMSPKGGVIIPHTRFQVQSKRSEVLFVDYIAEHLTPNGRAAIVVPEGIIFQSQSAYVALRKMLVENHLAAVISLPAGVFNPYSGVKTSILILDRAVAKASKHVAFFKIENDGFALGAQRKAVKGSQLAQVKAELGAWLQAARAGGGEGLESSLGSAVGRARLAEGGDYNLSSERYSSTNEVVRAYPMVPLGEVATLLNGRAYKQEELLDEGPVPVLRVGNFFSNRGWYFSDLELPPEKYCHPGDLLFAWSASFGPKIWDGPKAIYHYHIWKVVPGDQIDKHFLYWVLRAEAESIKAEGSGIAMIHATKSGMEKRLIPLPPLDVQREIVAEVEGYQRVIDGARAVLDNYRPHIPVDPEWQADELQNLVDTVTPPIKLQTSEYGKTGEIPIIDQSQDYIAGWTNQAAAAIDPQDGLVIFGDHTCAVKFVDRPFAQGADGIKILRTRQGLLPKYLALYLQAYPLAQDGYRRHFSKLKEYPIRFPALDVQQAIVSEIEAEQALVNGNRDLIARFEKKIDAAIARVWGEAKAEASA